MLSQRKTILAIVDLAFVASAVLAAAFLVYGWDAGLAYVQGRFLSFLVLPLLAPPVFYVSGLYSTRRLRSARSAVLPAAASMAVLLLVTSAFWYVTVSPEVGRRIIWRFAALTVCAIVAVRFVHARSHGILDVRALVVGSPRLALDVAKLLLAHPGAPLRIVGAVRCDEEPGPSDRDARVPAFGYPVLGDLDALEALVAEHRISRIILPARLRMYPALLRRVRPLSYQGVTLVDFVSLHEELAKEIPLEHVDDDWLFAAASAPSQLHIRRLKRMTDVLASVLLLVAATPILLVAAATVKLTSRGPVLFRQERSGLGSRPFMVLKLRTMRDDAEKLTGPVWSTDDDPRITWVGRILRKFRIDELPQLWNVLRGDMSLVGPRPERPVFVEKLSDVIPHYSERLLVRPGITGWAQVLAPYAASVGDSARKLQFDLYYTKNLSLSLDLLILLLTAKTVVFGRERAQGGMTAGQQLATIPTLERANASPMLDPVMLTDGKPRPRDVARA